MLPMVKTGECMNWCADQFFHANSPHIPLILISAGLLLAFFFFEIVWDRLEQKPFSEEKAEKIMRFLLQLSLILLVIFLVYHYFIYEPKVATDFVNNASILNGTIDSGIDFIGGNLNGT